MTGAAVEAYLWPLAGRAELTARLAAAARLGPLGPEQRFELAYADVTPALSARARAALPAVLRAGTGAGALLGVAGVEGGQVRLVAPDGRLVSCDAAAVAAWLRAPAEKEARAGLEDTVARAGITGTRAAAVTAALCAEALGAERIAEGTRLVAARRSIWSALAAAGALRRGLLAIVGYLAQLALLAGLWWAVAGRALAGGGATRAVWIGLIAALVGMRLASSWTAGRLAIDVGAVLRERLLQGLLRLDTEAIRAEGIGQLLGRIVETEALEALALGGGLAAAAGTFELATGAAILTLGIAPGRQLALLAGLLLAAWPLAAWVQRALARWSAQRLALTHDLVERMVGQRTLVVQQPPELRHADEDQALGAYAEAGRRLDRGLALLSVLVPRGWLIAGVVSLAPWLAQAGARPGAFATSLGGVLLIYGALRKLALAFPALGAARISWRQARPMFERAGTAADMPGDLNGSPDPAAAENAAAPLLVARDLRFHYPGRPAVLEGCGFEIRKGDRILLEGPSGGGKSTLGALLTGLRVPDGGTLTLQGVDQKLLGPARWRARVGAAPQFHENHVFSASLLFNLLLGRAWPPRREDLVEADALLRELDLGPLLARMPSGLEQLVGESGWQLSHGERSRLYIARSLLQPLDARVLDESFAALDPETLERVLACVLKRAETLVVIAHP